MDLNGIKVVSWDVDGTLYSVHRMIFFLCQRALTKVASTSTWKDLRRLVLWLKTIKQIRVLGQDPRVAWSKDLHDIQVRWWGEAVRAAGLREGLLPLIKFFQQRGFRQVVVSDYEALYKVEALGLTGIFEHLYAGEHMGVLKPNPELFRKVFMDLDIEPGQLVHIGDQPERDGVAAKGAGCKPLILGVDFNPQTLLQALEKD